MKWNVPILKQGEKQNICLLKKNNVSCALVENLIIFLALNALFKACIKSDDYFTAQIAYGAFSGHYDVHLVYNNVILGYIIMGLLKIFPKVAWYTVLQVVSCYLALSTMTCLWKTKNYGKQIYYIFFPVLIFFSYELYIKITFTKTAGCLVVCGLLLLYEALEQKKNIWLFFVGVAFVELGYIYRNSVFYSILPFFIALYVVKLFRVFRQERASKETLARSLKLCFALGAVLLMSNGLQLLNERVYFQDQEWGDFRKYDGLRSQLIDQTTNNYEEYWEDYEAINCSKNDLELLYSSNLNYHGLWNSQWYKEIVAIAKKSSIPSSVATLFDVKQFIKFFHEWWSVYTGYGIFIILLMTQFLSVIEKKENYIYALVVDAGMIAENWYLQVAMNRTYQSHVDVYLILAAQMFFLFVCDMDNTHQEKNNKWLFYFLTVTVIINQYSYLQRDTFLDYIQSPNVCNASKNKYILDTVIQDKEHLYLFPAQETTYSLWQYEAYDIIPQGIYSNLYSPCLYRWPSQRSALEKYEVDNPMQEIAYDDSIRFMVSDEIEEKNVEMYETYCREHVDPRIEFVKIKEIDSLNIYKCILND